MADAARIDIFEEKPVPEAVFRLALPTMFGQIVLVVYNMADTFFIGRTGSDAAISAATVCMPAFMFLTAISNLFGVGGSSEISRCLGRKENERAKAVSAFSFWGCLGVSILYSLGALAAMRPFLSALGAKNTVVYDLAKEYLLVTVVIGGVFTALGTFFSHLIRSEGHNFRASAGIILGALLNIGLDPLFMFVILPEGNEVLGAAIATMLSNLIAFIYFVAVMRRNRTQSVLSFHPDRSLFSKELAGAVLSTGLPACIMTLFENISYALLDNLMARSGVACQAGIGVAKKINMLAHSTVRGLSQGVLPLMAYNHAAHNRRRLQKTIRFSLALAVGIAGACTVISLIWAVPLAHVFIPLTGPSVLYGASFLRILAIGAPFSAFAYMIISFFQAVGRGRKSFLIAILRKGIIDMPLMLLLFRVFSPYGIVCATPAADIICSAIAAGMFVHFMRLSDPEETLL